MSANQEHVHLAWPLWSDLKVIPTHGKFCSLVRPLAIFARSCLVDLIRMTTSVGNNSVFRSFFEKQKLTGPNFIDWYIQLRLVLSTEDKEKYMEQPILVAPVTAALDQPIPPQALATYNEWVKNQKEIDVMMLLTMYLEIQRNLAHLGANDMLIELKALYSKQAEQELLQTVRDFHTCKQEEGQSSRKGPKNKNKKPSKAAKGVQGKGKGKKAYANAEPSYAPKPKNLPPPKKDNPAKDAICHHYGEVGKGSKKLNPGALSLYVGNGQREAVVAIGNYHLCLPSGLVIVLNNCHYAPSITRGIISVSCLYEDGFINRFELNNTISVSKNNVVYFTAIPRDGLYEIEMSCSNTNDSSMYAVSNKRAKLNLDSSLLWHCRLGHISKKRIEKLQHDGLLNSSDIESLGKCVSCMSGKMARKPYSHQVERAKDLLGLIHRFGMFLDHLKEHEIIAHHTPPYTPQHNRVSKRRNRTLLDMVRSMMSQNTLLKSFWDYALESVACILNMVPTKKVNKTPYKIWHGQAPKLSYLKVWGYEPLVKRDTLTKPDKLDPRSFKCIFIGYPKETMGYSFYNPSENKVFVARNAEFFESNLIDQEASGSLEDLEIIQEEDTNPSLDTS
ncbi:putative reverse transcriptase domain-containing protein [Tanacetum coccineum]